MPYLPSLLEQLGVNAPSEQRLRRRARQASLIEKGAIRAPSTEGLWGKGLHSKRALALARARLRPETPDPVAGPEIPEDLANALAFQEQAEGEPVPGFNFVKGLLGTPLNDIGPKIEMPGPIFDLPGALGIEDDNPIANANDAASEAIFGDAATDPEGGSLGEALAFGATGGAAGIGVKTGLRLGANALGRRGGATAASKAAPKAVSAPPSAVPIPRAAGGAPKPWTANNAAARIRGAGERVGAGWRGSRKRRWQAAGVLAGSVPAIGLARSGYQSVDQGSPTLAPLLEELTMGGAVKDATNAVGNAAEAVVPGIGGRFLKDAIDLPAVAIPSVYMAGRAGVNAAGGDSSELEAMWDGLVEESFVANLVRGDWQGAADSFNEHPLYALLEGTGVGSIGSRAAGATARALPATGRTAAIRNHPAVTRLRAPLSVPGRPLELREVSPLAEGALGPRHLAPKPRVSKPGLLSSMWAQRRDTQQARRNADHYPNHDPTREAMMTRGIPATRSQAARIGNEAIDRNVGAYVGLLRDSTDAIQNAFHDLAKSVKGTKKIPSERYNTAIMNSVADVTEFRLRTSSTEAFLDDLAKLEADAQHSIKTRQLDLDGEGSRRLSGEEVAAASDNLNAYADIRRTVAADPEFVARAAAVADSLRPMMRKIEDDRLAQGLILPEQAEMARLLPAFRQHLDDVTYGRVPENYKGPLAAVEEMPNRTVLQGGQPVEIKELKRQLQKVAPGAVRDAAFVSQRPGAAGMGSNAWRSIDQPPDVRTGTRTGQGASAGIADRSYLNVMESVMGGSSEVTATQGALRLLADMAIHPIRAAKKGTKGVPTENGRFKTAKDAAVAARNPKDYGLPDGNWAVARITAPRTTPGRRRQLLEDFDNWESYPEQTHVRQGGHAPDKGPGLRVAQEITDFEGAPPTPKGGAGDYALVDRGGLRRVQSHFEPSSASRRAIQQISGTIKRAILPTSPKWLLANLVDTSLRAALSGTPPVANLGGAIGHKLGSEKIARVLGGHHETAMRVLKELEELEAAGSLPKGTAANYQYQIGGSLYGSIRNAPRRTIRRDHTRGAGIGGGRWDRAADRMADIAETAAVTNVREGYLGFANRVFAANQKFIEDPPRYSAAGKHMKEELRAFTDGAWKPAAMVTNKEIAQMAKGVSSPAQLNQVANVVERTFGKWHSLSPAARKALVDYAPFGAWAVNSFNFVFRTMPRDHPIKSALITAAAEMTEEERIKLGLSAYAEPNRRLPPNLRSSLPNRDGSLSTIGNMTSFGQWSDPSEAANFILPFIPDELGGTDWLGQQTEDEDGNPIEGAEHALAAMASLLETGTPFLPAAKRVFGFKLPGDPRAAPDSKGAKVFSPIPHRIDAELLDAHIRGDKQNIQVPTSAASEARKASEGGIFGGGLGGIFGEDDEDEEGIFGGGSGGGIFD